MGDEIVKSNILGSLLPTTGSIFEFKDDTDCDDDDDDGLLSLIDNDCDDDDGLLSLIDNDCDDDDLLSVIDNAGDEGKTFTIISLAFT
jgi:hypothetical protein